MIFLFSAMISPNYRNFARDGGTTNRGKDFLLDIARFATSAIRATSVSFSLTISAEKSDTLLLMNVIPGLAERENTPIRKQETIFFKENTKSMTIALSLSTTAAIVALTSLAATSNSQSVTHDAADCHRRISDYINTYQQRFFVVDPSVHEAAAVFEDPNAPVESPSRVYWICKPHRAPSTTIPSRFVRPNNRSVIELEDVVAHGLTYSIDTGLVSPNGYVATAWEGDGYEEFLIGYESNSVHQIKPDVYGSGGFAISGLGLSGVSSLSGAALSGKGEWVTDVEDPRLVAMSQVLGIALTQENCDNYFTQAKNEGRAGRIEPGHAHRNVVVDEALDDSGSGIGATSMNIILFAIVLAGAALVV
jgi:hypothetical protein